LALAVEISFLNQTLIFRLNLIVRIKHRGNFQNRFQFRQRKQMLHQFIKSALHELKIGYHLPTQKVTYGVASQEENSLGKSKDD
jgi:hypothetical protein